MFAEKIKKLRKTLGWSQLKLATVLKTSQAGVSHWEKGFHVAHPDKLELLKRLCKKYKMRISFTEYMS
jgi:transcriptional regulator with XRE-family HTH domain